VADKYYVRIEWLRVPTQTMGGRGYPALLPCYVQGACLYPPGTPEFQLVRKELGVVVAEKAHESMGKIAVASGPVQLEEYAHELFRLLVERFSTRELVVETPTVVYEHIPQ